MAAALDHCSQKRGKMERRSERSSSCSGLASHFAGRFSISGLVVFQNGAETKVPVSQTLGQRIGVVIVEEASMAHIESSSKLRHRVGPIIGWPGNSDLNALMPDLHRLNPQLCLRPAADGGYLVYNEELEKAFEIAFPPGILDDDLLVGMSEVNKGDWFSVSTDLGDFSFGPRRFERTTGCGLLVRPNSWDVACAIWSLSRRAIDHQHDAKDVTGDELSRLQWHWGVVRGPNEVWEFDFAFHLAGHYWFPDGKRKTDREWWSTVPIGVVSYIDRYDLSIENHFERAATMVESGCMFAIVGDLEVGELREFRANGVRRSTENIFVPEMGFEVPVGVTGCKW